LAELIRRTASNPSLVGEVPELARELHGSALSLVSLLGDVLDVARFDSGKIEIQESEFSLGDLLAEEFRRLQPLAREKDLTLRLVPPERPVRLRADRIKLSRVIGNLVGNAIKFTDEGEVCLEGASDGGGDAANAPATAGTNGSGTSHGGAVGGGSGRAADDWAVVRVTDTGVGIAPEHVERIFDEFFQLRNPERNRDKGTGLGLTICKRLVDAMGGRLAVDSTPGRGTTFTVRLPIGNVLGPPVPAV
jgi:signal transduction histidine kinase